MKLATAFAYLLLTSSPALATEADITVCFTPAQHCEPKIVEAIDQAKHSIRLQAYALTSFPIIHALQRAEQRGVDVKAILDKTNDKKYSGATLLAAYHIPVWVDYIPKIAHNKVIVIDGDLTVGGSYNYTKSAEHRNAENVTFTRSKAIAAAYLANWKSRRSASRPFGAPPTDQ